ncbi:unnamed protein product [Gordionus sp. m RMFG-2023]
MNEPQEDKVNEFNSNLSSNRNIMNGDKIWYKTFKGNMWDKGMIKRKNGNLTFEVETGDKIIRRHLDQIKKGLRVAHLWMNTVNFRRNDDQNVEMQEQCLVSQRPSRNIMLPKKFDNL